MGRYIGEGLDDARIDTLFLAMPISWQGTLQYTWATGLRPFCSIATGSASEVETTCYWPKI
jgi:hypothetical protein